MLTRRSPLRRNDGGLFKIQIVNFLEVAFTLSCLVQSKVSAQELGSINTAFHLGLQKEEESDEPDLDYYATGARFLVDLEANLSHVWGERFSELIVCGRPIRDYARFGDSRADMKYVVRELKKDSCLRRKTKEPVSIFSLATRLTGLQKQQVCRIIGVQEMPSTSGQRKRGPECEQDRQWQCRRSTTQMHSHQDETQSKIIQLPESPSGITVASRMHQSSSTHLASPETEPEAAQASKLLMSPARNMQYDMPSVQVGSYGEKPSMPFIEGSKISGYAKSDTLGEQESSYKAMMTVPRPVPTPSEENPKTIDLSESQQPYQYSLAFPQPQGQDAWAYISEQSIIPYPHSE
ncbi:hypothetical protein ACLMJK_009516 [Lecanora helva]